MKVCKLKEIHLKTPNKVGVLAEISESIKGAGVNIEAICAYGMEDKAYFMIATDNNAKAIIAVKSVSDETSEKSVVKASLENEVGALKDMCKKLADSGIDINYIYGTTDKTGSSASVIFSSNNDAKAVEVLQN